MSDETAIVAAQRPGTELDLFDETQFGRAMELAKALSSATGWVPRHLLGNPGACLGIVSLSSAWRVNPFLLAAASSDVHGKLLFEAKAVQAGIERSGALKGRLQFAYIGDWDRLAGKFTMVDSARKQDENGNAQKYAKPAWRPEDEEGLAIEVTGTPAGSEEPVTVRTLLKACHPRNSTLWATDPATQARYRATRNWARLAMPGVMLGAVSQDEYDGPGEINVTAQGSDAPAPAKEAPPIIRKPRTPKAEPAAPVQAAASKADPSANPEAETKLVSVLAAIDSTRTPRGLAVRYLQAHGKLEAGRGLDALTDQPTMRAIHERPGDFARAVSEWEAEQTLMAEQQQQTP